MYIVVAPVLSQGILLTDNPRINYTL